MKKVSVIGHFAFGYEYFDGQTIKTKIVTNELCNTLGENEVMKLDTHGGKKTLLKAPIYSFCALRKAKNVVIFPAHNGVRIFGRLLPLFKLFFKNRKIHYVVIGGWLPELLKSKKQLSKCLKKFDGIYVETQTMKKALAEQGFENIIVMPNCKELNILDESELDFNKEMPLRLCTFSRVSEKKGIADAVNAVKNVNEKLGYTAFSLDIYGQVDNDQHEWFDALKKDFPDYVRYCGVVEFSKSVDILKNYFALLFPTHYFTEGIPGTIIDAYAAGVPVISAKWESCFDIVDDGITGFVYDFDDQNQFEKKLLDVAAKPEILVGLKKNCIEKAVKYTPGFVCNELLGLLD